MDYAPFIKKLDLPAGFTPPRQLRYDDIVADAITREHLRDDVDGINASIELIQRTRGGGWPTGPVTDDYNFVDLVWHEAEFRDGGSFTYVVHDTDEHYLGSCYTKLYAALGHWLATEFPFWTPYYSNAEVPR